MFTCRREGETVANAFRREIGKITEDLLLAHPAGQVLQHVVNRDPSPHKTGLSASHTRIYDDVLLPAHPHELRRRHRVEQSRFGGRRDRPRGPSGRTARLQDDTSVSESRPCDNGARAREEEAGDLR